MSEATVKHLFSDGGKTAGSRAQRNQLRLAVRGKAGEWFCHHKARAFNPFGGDYFYGIAEGKNVIFISLESTQNFVINEKMNGQTITPFLNKLIKSIRF